MPGIRGDPPGLAFPSNSPQAFAALLGDDYGLLLGDYGLLLGDYGLLLGDYGLLLGDYGLLQQGLPAGGSQVKTRIHASDLT